MLKQSVIADICAYPVRSIQVDVWFFSRLRSESGRYLISRENLCKSAKSSISFQENNCFCDIVAIGDSFPVTCLLTIYYTIKQVSPTFLWGQFDVFSIPT